MRSKNLLSALLVLSFFAGCGGEAPSPASKLYKGKIAIGEADWPGYIALFVAEDRGYFREEGIDVEIKRYPGTGAVSKDYAAGTLQGRANLASEAIDEALNGLDHKVVLVIDYSNGSDGIAAAGPIKDLRQARGKRVAYEHGTMEEYFLLYALEQNGMSLKDVVPVDLDPEAAAKALTAGKVDVAVTYEPHLSEAIRMIGGNKIYTSADAPGLITDLLTFRTDFIKAYPETVAAVVRAYFRGLNFLKERPAEAHAVLGRAFGNTPEEIAAQLKGVTLLDERDNGTALTFSVGAQSLYGNLRRVSDFILRRRSKEGDASPNIDKDTDKMIDKRFIKALTKDGSPDRR